MSKSKKITRQPKDVAKKQPSGQATTNNKALMQKLEAEQEANLIFCEKLTEKTVCGVNIFRAMTYSFVQFLNHATLEEIL